MLQITKFENIFEQMLECLKMVKKNRCSKIVFVLLEGFDVKIRKIFKD